MADDVYIRTEHALGFGCFPVDTLFGPVGGGRLAWAGLGSSALLYREERGWAWVGLGGGAGSY